MSFLKLPSLNIGREESSNRICCLGTVGSGKTTVQQLILLTSLTKMQGNDKFDAHIVEKSIGAIEAVSNLYAGKFPPKTTGGRIFESILEMRRSGYFGEKLTYVAFVDAAGEEITKLIMHLSKGIQNVGENMFSEARLINENIIRCSGFIIIAAVPRTVFGSQKVFEREAGGMPGNPDVNLSRLIEAIYFHKQRTGSRKVDRIGVVFTKADMLHHPLAVQGFDLTAEDGRLKFLRTFYPLTYSSLRWYDKGLKNVHFWPSCVELEYDPVTKLPLEWAAGEADVPYKIRVDNYLPVYSDDAYMDIVDWLSQ